MGLRLIAAIGALTIGWAAASAQTPKLNDAQIAHIAYTAGTIDINAAQLALEKSKNKEVRTFAEDMVRDHKAVNDQALALVKKLNVTPQDNDTSKALLKQAAEKQELLEEAERRRVRQGLCRKRGRLPQGRRFNSSEHADSVGEQSGAEGIAVDGAQDLRGS